MRVAVVGGGIAGLASAIALGGRGFGVDVFERAPVLQEIGAGLQLSPNAMAPLARLGVAEHLDGCLVEPDALVIRNGTSEATLTRISLGETVRARYGAPYCTVHRADLQAALVAAAVRRPEIALHLGAEVSQVDGYSDGVGFRVNGELQRCDVLVAANGVRSAIRTRFFEYPAPYPLGRTAWRATLPLAEARDLVSIREVVLWLGKGAHLVHYPLARDGLLNVVVIARDDTPPIARFGSAARRLLEAARPFTQWPLAAVDAGLPWVKGRVALVGDAAHAMAPSAAQGGAQAIEDAWALAMALGRRRGSPEKALGAYQRARQRRAVAVARISTRNMELYEAAAIVGFGRDVFLKLLPASVLLRRLDWLFRHEPK